MVNFKVNLHSGNLSYKEREEVMRMFRGGRTDILVATNVLCRGIQGQNVVAVINFDVPLNQIGTKLDMKTYINRIGRTGRFGERAIAISFLCDSKAYEVAELAFEFSTEIEFV